MGFTINQNKLKRNKIMSRKSINLRLNRNMKCKAPCITTKLPNGSWKGRTCFLIGGGPSLTNFDFNFIKNELTIGINKSFTRFSATVNYAMDVRFFDMVTYAQKPEWKELHQQWLEYKGIKVFMRRRKKFKFDKGVYIVDSLPSKAISFDLDKGIWVGNNSGFGALMLAIGLGCKRIGLLGFDLKVQGTGNGVKTHFHGGYKFQDKKSFQSKLDKFRGCFEEFAPTIAQQGVEVVNLVEKDEDSKLTCFPKSSLANFLK